MKFDFEPGKFGDDTIDGLVSFILYIAYKEGTFDFSIGIRSDVWETVPGKWLDYWFTIEGDDITICLSDEQKSILVNEINDRQAIPHAGIWIPVILND